MPLLTLKVAQGLNCDAMPEDLAAGQWSDGRNVRFRNGFAERMRGSTQVFAAPTVTPYYVAPYAVPAGRYVVHAGLQRVFADNGTARTDITPAVEVAAVSSITASGTTATLTTATAHGRATGDQVVVIGAAPAAFNGSFAITVTSPTAFTYTLAAAPGGNATAPGRLYLPTVQPFTGARDDRWSGGALNGVLVLNNGKDIPVYWGGDTATKLQTLPGWSANDRCAFLVPFKSYLVALDITRNGVRFPHMLKWSAAAEPGNIPTSWDIANGGLDAGEVTGELASTPDPIVGAAVLGDVLIVYKERSMFVVRFTGDRLVFSIQRIQGTDGMLARGCVADTPAGHVVLGNGDVVVHQGQGAKSIVEGRMRRWLFANLDASKKARAFVVANPKCAEVWICFASVYSQACDRALVWNWADDTLAVRTLPGVNYGAVGQIPAGVLPNTWATDQQRWIDDVTVWTEDEFGSGEAVLLLARDAPLIAIAETGGTDSGAPLVAYLERRAMDLDDPYTRKLVRGVLPRMSSGLAGTQVSVRAGGSMVSNEAPTWTDPVPFSIGQDEKVDLFSSGRYASLRIDSNSIQPWRMRSLGLDVQPQGRF